MKHELRRLGVIRTANVVAVVYAALMAVFALIALPLVGIAIAIGATQGQEAAAISGAISGVIMLVLIVLYPVMGLIFGWITGLITAAAYNLVASWIGGLMLDLQPEQ